VEKPDPAIFRAALQKLGVAPSEAIHVGDLPAVDFAGARAAGIHGILVDRRKQLAPSHGALHDLRPLPELVRGRET
jgi:putative hydrolase of the HAD superfamily